MSTEAVGRAHAAIVGGSAGAIVAALCTAGFIVTTARDEGGVAVSFGVPLMLASPVVGVALGLFLARARRRASDTALSGVVAALVDTAAAAALASPAMTAPDPGAEGSVQYGYGRIFLAVATILLMTTLPLWLAASYAVSRILRGRR